MRAVIFDWGGTLTPWRNMRHLDGWRSYASALHPDDEARAAAVAAALLAAEDAAWATARTEHRAFHIADILRAAGVPDHDGGFTAFRAFWDPATFTDPEVAPLLTELRGRGLRTGVLSSTSWPADWHEDVLRRDGVLDLFHGRVWSSDLTHTKPHASAFLAAMAAVGVTDPADCVYVGDRLYDDVSGAQAVGMRAVLVPHSDIPADQLVPVDATPDAVVHRLSDLPAVLDRWAMH
jgi:FMN hydrolase / 5-amino-6-(5-phospho-D-ribitylamino)uracil phosphatase